MDNEVQITAEAVMQKLSMQLAAQAIRIAQLEAWIDKLQEAPKEEKEEEKENAGYG